jgi:UPF0716 family protein affecting phage T7 exclusion
MKEFLKQCVSSNSKVSSKRIITIAAFILMAIGFLSNLYFKFTIDPVIYEAIQWIVISGLGFTASEQFSKFKNKAKGTDEPQ